MNYSDQRYSQGGSPRTGGQNRSRRQARKRRRRNRLILLCVLIVILLIIAAVVIVRIGGRTRTSGDEETFSVTEAEAVPLYEGSDDTVEETFLLISDQDQADERFVSESAAEELEQAEANAALLAPSDVLTDGRIRVGNVNFVPGYTATVSPSAAWPSEDDVQSTYAVLIDESTGTIVAQKNPNTRIYPASMTKILTILVAAEHITTIDDTFTVTREITDYAYKNGCSIVGFDVDEEVPLIDLFYGTILPSGADAALSLAVYTAGSHEAFVALMNEKLTELGISETAHFTNCVGIYDDENYCTVSDMAVIMKAAVENNFCREVLSAHTYTTTPTPQHPEGIAISNWFLRRIEDKDSGGLVVGAKTGFVNESGNCAASYEISDSGVPYICVTADAHSAWRCIYDHVAMYKLYAP